MRQIVEDDIEELTPEQWRIRLSICEAAIDALARERIELTDPDEINENDRLTREAIRGADFAEKSLAAAVRRLRISPDRDP